MQLLLTNGAWRDLADDDKEETGSPAAANRRPVRERRSLWAARLARAAAARGIQPNRISLASVGCSIAAALLIVLARFQRDGVIAAACYLAAGLLIPARLICNLIDGMVAVEHGLRSKSGEIYNELPDRISDAVVLAAAGYAAGWGLLGVSLGWGAALLAVLTAYIRALGGAAGARQFFVGPMAKQMRMMILAVACGAAAVERLASWPPRALGAALAIIALGCIVTLIRRTRLVVADLEAMP